MNKKHMKTIWVTQRVTREANYAETRDAIDQQWVAFLLQAGYFVQLVPNNKQWLANALEQRLPCDGILLTGGNDLALVGGDAPVRDDVEQMLLAYAVEVNIPCIGVCRGMQLIAAAFGGALQSVAHQVQQKQINIIDGQPREVNSYHCWELTHVPDDFSATAWDENFKVIKGIQHLYKPIYGVMWHPERIVPFSEHDISFFQRVYS